MEHVSKSLLLMLEQNRLTMTEQQESPIELTNDEAVSDVKSEPKSKDMDSLSVIELDGSDNKSDIEIKTNNDITPREIFRLAKWILGVGVGLFTLIALFRIAGWGNTEATKEVWDYTKVAINSIISIVIGFYFGNRMQNRS